MPNLAARVISDFRVTVLIKLNLVMQVNVVVAVDVVIAIERARAQGSTIVVLPYHFLVLSLRVPAHLVAKVDARDAGFVDRVIVRIAKLPDVFFAQSIEDAKQVIRLIAH